MRRGYSNASQFLPKAVSVVSEVKSILHFFLTSLLRIMNVLSSPFLAKRKELHPNLIDSNADKSIQSKERNTTTLKRSICATGTSFTRQLDRLERRQIYQ